MEESHRRGRLGSGGERTAEEHAFRHIHRGKRRDPRTGFKRPGGHLENDGFDDWSVQVRNIRDAGQPIAKEHQENMTTHRPYADHGASSV